MLLRVFVALLFCSLGLVFSAHADVLRVVLLLSEQNAAYQEFERSFAAQVDPSKIKLVVAQANTFNANAVDADLVIAAGYPAASVAFSSSVPLLCVMVSRAAYQKLQSAAPTKIASALYLDQPYTRQFKLLVAALPKAKRVALLYSVAPADLANLRQAAQDNQLQLQTQSNVAAEFLHRDLAMVLDQSDVLLALPDSQIYNASTLRNILLQTYRQQIPLIGFSQSFVKAGALLAIVSSPQQTAQQTLSMLAFFHQNHRLSVPQYPKEFEVLVNQQVAYSLQLNLPEAAKLREMLLRGGGGD